MQGWTTVPAPIGQPPVFYKNSSTYDWQSLNIPLVPGRKDTTTPTSGAALTTNSLCGVGLILAMIISAY